MNWNISEKDHSKAEFHHTENRASVEKPESTEETNVDVTI